MTEQATVNMDSGRGRGGKGPRIPGFQGRRPGKLRIILALVLSAAIIYGGYFWFVRRVVVDADHVLVLMKKNGSRSLPGDQVVIPRMPDRTKNPESYAQWQSKYADVNGIIEEVYLPGTYFRFSPFDYERELIPITGVNNGVDVPGDKIAIVVKKFGQPLPPGQIFADLSMDQRGPLQVVLQPGKHTEYANPHAYEIKWIDPVVIDPGHRGVVTLLASSESPQPNRYLVDEGQRGVQRQTEPEGFLYVNPFAKRVTPVSIRSHRFEMGGTESIRFPSSDSFDIKLEGFVEWSIVPDRLPQVYVQYGEGNELIPYVEEKVILPYARSFCRLVGSQYSARDFISGDTKLKFQQEFASKLREACEKQGIEILQALVRDIEPPDAIKNPINEREVAKQQINSLDQQILVAKSQAELATQEQVAMQNQAIGEANKQVVTVVKKAERERDVTLTEARQRLAVAKLRLDAAQKEADAQLAKGKAEADVVLLNKQAEAEPLRQQVEAFGDGTAYARYFFYQKVAPSMKSILSNTDGVFADLFKQYAPPPVPPGEQPKPVKSTVQQSQDKPAKSVSGVQP